MASASTKRALRRAKLTTKRQMHAERKVTTPEVKAAGSTREVYAIALAEPGATLSSVAKRYGVTRQSVHQLTTGYRAKVLQNRKQDDVRRVGTREYTCGACGGVGHNARTCNEKKTA
jgi:hypothetical protein